MTALAGDTFSLDFAARKKALRRELRARRTELSYAIRRRSARLAAKRLLGWRFLRRARKIAVYLPIRNELDTAPLIAALRRIGASLFAPRIDHSREMHFLPLAAGRHAILRRDALGLTAPPTGRPRLSPRRLDIVVLPLLGFDPGGARLGMGAGFYDRSLDFRRIGRRPRLIGYAFAEQEVEHIPAEAWDVRLDAVVLPSGLRWLHLTSGE